MSRDHGADVPAGDPVYRAIARCIEIVREVRDGFLSPEYATHQPLSSLTERFACDQVVRAIEDEFGLGVEGVECAQSPFGRHQVDTSMESGPNNCFFCEQPMRTQP